MVLLLLGLLSCGLIYASSGQALAPSIAPQNSSREVVELLNQLVHPSGDTHRDFAPWFGPPDPETIDRVRTRLIEMADQSSKSRGIVIGALVDVLNHPKPDIDARVHQWRIAVGLLGDLKATEAIDDLVRNLDRVSYYTYPHPPSPVITALVHIGKPAIPSLLNVLSDSNEFIRIEASEALREIGEPALDGLLDKLMHGVSLARIGAAYTLARFGGTRVRQAIESALYTESDADVRKELENSIEFMNYVDCLNDSTKCK